MKNDFKTAFVKADALLAPSLLKIVLPAEASRARKANKIYSTIDRILFFIRNKRPTYVSQLFINIIIECGLCFCLWSYGPT